MAGSSTTDEQPVVLECDKCGERTVLGGPLSVWLSERTFFECECGKRLTLTRRKVEVGASNL